MALKNFNPVANNVYRCNSGLWCILDERVSQSFQVGKRVSRVNYFRHVNAFGRVA